jgi:hypothetical protein
MIKKHAKMMKAGNRGAALTDEEQRRCGREREGGGGACRPGPVVLGVGGLGAQVCSGRVGTPSCAGHTRSPSSVLRRAVCLLCECVLPCGCACVCA